MDTRGKNTRSGVESEETCHDKKRKRSHLCESPIFKTNSGAFSNCKLSVGAHCQIVLLARQVFPRSIVAYTCARVIVVVISSWFCIVCGESVAKVQS